MKTNLNHRESSVRRTTAETDVQITLAIDGTGQTDIQSGLGFLDHMLSALTFHSRMDLQLRCKGDLHIDDHHTVEDCALAMGEALAQAVGKPSGITRFGSAYAPLDEALARAVVDFSGRPFASVELGFVRPNLGDVATENLTHFFRGFAMAAGITLHLDVLRGENDHHRAEAAFKATALALRQALARVDDPRTPSTKGTVSREQA